MNQGPKEAFVPMSDTAGNREQMRYCPSCGVVLNGDFRRWEGTE